MASRGKSNSPVCGSCGVDKTKPDVYNCNACYVRENRKGFKLSERPGTSECAVEDCLTPPRSKYALYCEKHYGRIRRNGNTDRTLEPIGVCLQCDTTIPEGRFYCSGRCSTRHSRGRIEDPTICPICSTSKTMRTDAVYCSKKCTVKAFNLRKNYGLTVQEYLHMFEIQNNLCKICFISIHPMSPKIAVDHCHTSLKVRGILCENCNFLLGNAKDNISTLKSAITYLENSNG